MNSNFKRQKTGKSFPGSLPRKIKIQMLEHSDREQSIHYGGDVYQIISPEAAASFKKDVTKRQNKRFRQQSKKELNDMT